MDRLQGDALGFVLPVLEYCLTVLQSGARLPIHTLNYWTSKVSGARFLTGGVFECEIAHRRSVAVLCMLYRIRCKAMHPLNGALPGPYVPVRVTSGVLVTHRYAYAPPHCGISQYSRTFILSRCHCGMILLTRHSMAWDQRVSRAGPMLFYWHKMLYPFYNLLLFFRSLLSVNRLVLWGWGLLTDRVHITLSQPCTADLFK